MLPESSSLRQGFRKSGIIIKSSFILVPMELLSSTSFVYFSERGFKAKLFGRTHGDDINEV